MNLLLLDRDEIDARGHVRVDGRRARHLITVLGVAPGDSVRAGVVDGPIGEARVLEVEAEAVRLEVDCAVESPPALDALLLAVPRPKVLARMLEHAAALGYGRIVLMRTWRVDKSHLASHLLDPAVQQEHLRFGLEQSRRTRLPAVTLFPLFKPFVEDHLDALALPPARFVAHPEAATETAALRLPPRAPFALAIGPDGGFLPYEVDLLSAHGFLPIRLGPHPLRTESALSVLHGQLDLLRQLGV